LATDRPVSKWTKGLFDPRLAKAAADRSPIDIGTES
jgi:hypothetical protein